MTTGRLFRQRLPAAANVKPLIRDLLVAIDASGLTDKDICARAGIATNSITTWRRGRFDPRLYALEAVAQVVGVRIALVSK